MANPYAQRIDLITAAACCGENNARILNPEVSFEEVKNCIDGAKKASELSRFHIAGNVRTQEDIESELQEMASSENPLFTVRAIR